MDLEALKDRTGAALHELGFRCPVVDADKQTGRTNAKVVEFVQQAIAYGRLKVSKGASLPFGELLPLPLSRIHAAASKGRGA